MVYHAVERRYFPLWFGLLLCLASGAVVAESLRLLVKDDPFGQVLVRHQAEFSTEFAIPLSSESKHYQALYRHILVNALRETSHYDLLAVDAVWLPDLVGQGVLTDLAACDLAADTYLNGAWASGQIADGRQFGAPIQPHPEILVYRKYVLDALGLEPPATLDALLTVAEATRNAGHGGLCWNGQAGAALGQTLLHLVAAFGGSVLEDGALRLDTPAMHQALAYLQRLLAVSHPHVLSMAWDDRMHAFREGECALSYLWSARVGRLFSGARAMEHDQLGYLAAPYQAGQSPVTPLGVWHLAIPANLPAARQQLACQALRHFNEPPVLEVFLRSGMSAIANRPTIASGAWFASFPVLALVADLDQRGELVARVRPPLREFQALSERLGNMGHEVLRGRISAGTALREVESQLLALRWENSAGEMAP